MNDSELKYTIRNLYGINPSGQDIEDIKAAIQLDTKEDHLYCKEHIRAKMKERERNGGKMPEGSNFVNE